MGVSKVYVEMFLSHSAENFRRRMLYCCINFGNRKSLEKRGGGVSKVYVEMFLSHSAENFRRRMLYCCINFGNRKSLEKGGGEYQKFPSKFFCVTVPKISVGESFSVALIFGEEGGGYQKFTSKCFCLTMPTKFSVVESFIVALILGIEKVWRRGGGVSRFSVENFCLKVPTKISVGESFIVAINSGIEKSLEERGGGRYQDFPSTIFCLTVTKISVGESFTVELITGSEKVWIGGGEVSRFSVEIFLSHSAEDFRRGLLYCCINFWGRGGYQNFTSKNFCLTVPTKISAGESFIVAINSGIEKSLEERGGEVSRFSVNNFLSHSPDEKFRRRILYCCFNFGYRKSLEQRGGRLGVSSFPVENFLSHSAENFHRGILQCCINFWRRGGGGVSKVYVEMFLSHNADEIFRSRILYCCINFGYRKSLEERGGGIKIFGRKFLPQSADEHFRRRMLYCCINFGNRKSLEKGGGEYQKFPSKFFCVTVPKISVGESFSVALIFGEEGGYQKFTSKCFCLTMPTKFSVVESFIVALILGIEKVWRRGGGGGIKIFGRKFLPQSADENFRRRILYCCNKFGYRKKFGGEGGGRYQDFPSTIFCLTVTKISVGESFTVALITGSEKVWIGGGEVSRFSVEKFLSHSAEDFRRGLLYCCINFWGRGGGYQNFTSKIFCLTVPTKISAGESFIVAINSGIEKSLEERGGGEVSRFSVNNFLSHSADEIFRRGMLYCCINFGNRKSLEKGGGVSKISLKNFLSHSAEYFLFP